MIAVAAERDYMLRQVDIGNTFVEALLPPDEDVYMDSIPGYERPGYVLRSVRSLHGLKSSPKHWADLLSKTLLLPLATKLQDL